MKIFGQTAGNKCYPITVDDDGDLQLDVLSIASGNNLIGRVEGHDGDKIWSFNRQFTEEIENLSANVGFNSLSGTVVGAGEIYILEAVTCYDKDNVATQLRVGVMTSGINIWLKIETSPVSGIPVMWDGRITLEANDKVIGQIYGATANDDIYLIYSGYFMKV